MSRTAVIIGRREGKLLSVGDPFEDPRLARDEYFRLMEDPGELEHIELWVSDQGRIKRKTIQSVPRPGGLPSGETEPPEVPAPSRRLDNRRNPDPRKR